LAALDIEGNEREPAPSKTWAPDTGSVSLSSRITRGVSRLSSRTTAACPLSPIATARSCSGTVGEPVELIEIGGDIAESERLAKSAEPAMLSSGGLRMDVDSIAETTKLHQVLLKGRVLERVGVQRRIVAQIR